MTRLPFAAAALGVLLLSTPALAQGRANDPIPGVDIIVQKNPGGTALVVGQSGADGWHRGPVRVEAGEYRVEGRCPPRVMCAGFRLASVRVNGRMIAPDAGGQYAFPVGRGVRQVRLEVQVVEHTDPRGPR